MRIQKYVGERHLRSMRGNACSCYVSFSVRLNATTPIDAWVSNEQCLDRAKSHYILEYMPAETAQRTSPAYQSDGERKY
jgi:hypothetical protein